jgi:hypothetical protein
MDRPCLCRFSRNSGTWGIEVLPKNVTSGYISAKTTECELEDNVAQV